MKEQIDTINVIIAGHIDHGKTTLLQRITGKWADSHSEELKRGITIKLGYADTTIYYDAKLGYNIDKNGSPKRYVSFIDAPGHEMLMATMLSGAAIVDAAILVVAANEGIKPQTKEHFMALQAKNIKNIIVVQNKIDLATKEQSLENYRAIKELIHNTDAENSQIIPISAKQNVNLDKLYEVLCQIPPPERNDSDTPVFLVARSFDINKPGTAPSNLKGTVLGGTLKRGKLKVGDEIEIKPGLTIKEANQIKYKSLKANILGLYKGSQKLEEITPGGSLAIETSLDMAVGKADILSGCVVSTINSLPEITSNLKIKYKLFPEILGANQKVKVEPLKTAEMLMLSINTAVTVGDVKKIKSDEAELNLRIPVVPFEKDNIGIARNINGHWRLIGFGEIIFS
ncbi:translation initiation factor IF-2 subunit gamma [Candidatus Pacearchaeota archaeon CG10_big_fil_rev_8_21_14_0_10_34_76]|nr:MAG: translation initiation factor IF-2 subunit gamma [Candidatus Pacearchaeota archaeon CG10_big_fil_rev_8_21_14_0_10_34_76]